MSTLKVDTIDTSDSSGNITVSRPLAGSGASLTALNATELTSGTIPIARIADDAVTTAKIADGAITAAKIADGTVVAAEIASNAVTTVKIIDDAVTTAKILNANVTTAKIAADAIDGTKLADNACDSEHYTDGSIDLAHMSANSIDSDQYVDGSVDNVHLASGIDAAKLTTGTLPMARLSGTLPALNGSALTALNATELTSGTIPIARIADDAVTTAKIAADAITAAEIGDDVINSEHYAAGSIDAEHLAVGKDGAFSLDANPDSDHTAVGPQTSTLSSGYSSTAMDLVYLGGGGKWLEADADATGTSINLLGIALEAKTDNQAMNVALPGSFVRDDTWAWTTGVPLYISNTLGAITASKPTGSGDVVRTVGHAVNADTIFFNPSSDYVTLA